MTPADRMSGGCSSRRPSRRLRPGQHPSVGGRSHVTGVAGMRPEPWRLRILPGSVMLGQAGDVLTWAADAGA
jgi:hypothetical protein